MKRYLLLPVLVLLVAISNAQIAYLASNGQNVSGTYSDLSTNGTAITTNFLGAAITYDDDNSAVQNIGFNFDFNGSTFTQFVLNTNGFIKLGSSTPSANNIFYTTTSGTTGGCINATDANLIYPFNHDLQGSGSSEYRVHTSGSAPNRVCTIQYKNVKDKMSTSPNELQYGNISFQIKLYETSNDIEFVYNSFTISANSSVSKSAAVGIKGSNAASSVNANKGSSTSWAAATFVNGDYTANCFYNRNIALPDAGRTYKFVRSVVVPLKFIEFYTKDNGNHILLYWKTANESNNNNFEVQRSVNGNDFKPVGLVSTSFNSEYNFIDADIASLNNTVYYRLKQYDKDGQFSFSSIVKLNRKASNSFLVTAINPIKDKIILQLQDHVAKRIQIVVANENGQILLKQEVSIVAGFAVIVLEESYRLNKGIYFVKLTTGDAIKVVKLIKE